MGGQHAVERRYRRRRVDRGLAHDLDLDDAAALEDIGEVGLREREEEIERGEQRARLEVGDVGAAAMAGFDDAQRRQRADRLAQARPADAEDVDQLALGGQPVARAQHAGPDQVEDPVDHRMRHPLLVARAEDARDGKQLRVGFLGHGFVLVREASLAARQQSFDQDSRQDDPLIRPGNWPLPTYLHQVRLSEPEARRRHVHRAGRRRRDPGEYLRAVPTPPPMRHATARVRAKLAPRAMPMKRPGRPTPAGQRSR